MHQSVKGKTCQFRGGGALAKAVKAITTEEQALALFDRIETGAKKEGDYTGALMESAINYITSCNNPVVNNALGKYCTGVGV